MSSAEQILLIERAFSYVEELAKYQIFMDSTGF